MQHPVLRVLGGGGGDEHERLRSGGNFDVLGRRLPHERPDDVDVCGPLAWILELRKAGDERKVAADPAVNVRKRGQPELLPCLVELTAATLQPAIDLAVGAAPHRPAGSRARQASAERIDRELALTVRIDVRDQGRVGHPLDLRGERRCEREDVRDDDLRLQVSHERERVSRCVHDGLVEVERLWTGRKDLVLRRGGEANALRLDGLAPASPGLERDLMTARDERTAQRDHGEGVTRVAEGAQQHPARGCRCGHRRLAQAASSASIRSCSRRSCAVNAVGVTPRVPTPASR